MILVIILTWKNVCEWNLNKICDNCFYSLSARSQKQMKISLLPVFFALISASFPPLPERQVRCGFSAVGSWITDSAQEPQCMMGGVVMCVAVGGSRWDGDSWAERHAGKTGHKWKYHSNLKQYIYTYTYMFKASVCNFSLAAAAPSAATTGNYKTLTH